MEHEIQKDNSRGHISLPGTYQGYLEGGPLDHNTDPIRKEFSFEMN